MTHYYDQYDRLLNFLWTRAKHKGYKRPSRPGVQTVSLVNETLWFDLTGNKVPLPNRKKIFFNSMWGELKTFLEGGTHTVDFERNGCQFWAPWGTREYLDANGLTEHQTGDLGPIYGAQWLKFGARSNPGRAALAGKIYDYFTKKNGHNASSVSEALIESILAIQETIEGANQLENLVEGIIKNPHSRRHMVTALNPNVVLQQALPPCHVYFQVTISDDLKSLSLSMLQRSADVFVGVPYNVASYAMVAHLLAAELNTRGFAGGQIQATNLEMILVDAHIYQNHDEAITEYFSREIANVECPTVALNGATLLSPAAGTPEIVGYTPHPHIQVPVAV